MDEQRGNMAPNQWGPPPQNTVRPPQRDHTKLSIWLAFAGTIITAIIGGCFAVVAARRGDSPPPAATGAAPPAPRQTTSAGQPPDPGNTTAAAPGGAGAVRWSGPLVGSNAAGAGLADAVELDTKPPQSMDNSEYKTDVSVGQIDGDRFEMRTPPFSSSASFMVWDGGGAPEFAQCKEAATARGVHQAPMVEVGAVLCVRTTEGRVARLTAKKIDAKAGSVTFDAVVWEAA
ncbi:hypothetical protein Dsi01nite_011350 [Dactylosporangium siamense]|uniref:Uncharacterized protein n=2 Tax=Dactylosporangium siamense TaxID=685454 RepID=A0A919PFQ1_9ACTN|nr:hypothetical protein Dsi01nite_011350 [Dactylosporangium siamense]